MMHDAYHDTQRAFSRSAPFYDSDERLNRVARWTRRRNLHTLMTAFSARDHLLEVGCGTGTEALALALRGNWILATDAAEGMVAELRRKINASSDVGAASRITPLVMPAHRLSVLVGGYGPASFDGAYSSFGPLNCEPDLKPVALALAELIRPGGKVVLSLIGRFCAWEVAWYLLHGERDQAFRRLSGQAEATVRSTWEDIRVPVFYRAPAEIASAFAPYFDRIGILALPWALPPQYLSGLFARRARLFRLLAAVEGKTANIWPFYLIGDHVCITLVRRSAVAGGDQG